MATESGAQIGTLSFLPTATTSESVTIGSLFSTTDPYDGTIAWALFYKDDELTTAQQLSVYTLYKQTLGQGLGLP